ncbi:MAG: aldehyde dehydrogenase [Paracoccaceae bacterium]
MKHQRLLRPWLWMAALCAVIAAPAQAFDDPEDMPEGPGREETFYTCVACHSMQVVVRQGMSKPMWDDTLTLMVERHGMWDLEEEERTLILDYLSKHFPAGEASGARRGWTNPFAP